MNNMPQNDSSLINRTLLLLIRLLIAVGVPIGVGWTFAKVITNYIWLDIILVIVYEICLLLGGFFGEVWQKLKSPLVDWVAQRITWWIKERFSKYSQLYSHYVVQEHQVFDVKGLSTRTAHDLELEHVFVELDVDPAPAHQISGDPLRISESLHQGEHDIWEYLTAPSLAQQQFVVIGAPGSGKTTLLKHLALSLAQRKEPKLYRYKFPLFIYLREFANTIKEKSDYSLVEAVQDHIRRKWQQVIPEQWINFHLKKGHCLILLDGLDEVADETTREQTSEWVQRQMLAYGQNRFILTSRPYGYRNNPIDGVTILEVRPFTPTQIERFIQNWYFANELKSWGKEEAGVHMRAREGAQDLLQRLHRTPTLLKLAVNPLLLTMITTIHRYRGSLPGKRVALYSEICEVFLGKRREAIGVAQELSSAQKQQVLQPLAYYLMIQGTQTISIDEANQIIMPHLTKVSAEMEPEKFLQMVQETSGIFLERDPGFYSFAHKTFQEYLAAVYIKEQQFERKLLDNLENPWWHETIRLFCAQADASSLITACLENSKPSVPALTLAIDCLQEALKVDPAVRFRLNTLLNKDIDDANIERRQLIAEAFLSQRLQQMVNLEEGIFIDTSLISCAEYQLFIEYQKAGNIYYQPDHWKTDCFTSGTGQNSVLGVRVADAFAFCEWLSKHTLESRKYRLPRREELEKIAKNKISIKNSEVSTGCWINESQKFDWKGINIPIADSHLKRKKLYSNIVDCFEKVLVGTEIESRFYKPSKCIYIVEKKGSKLIDIAFNDNLTLRFINIFENASNYVAPNDIKIGLNLNKSFSVARYTAQTIRNDQKAAYISDFELSDNLGLERDMGLERARNRAQALARLNTINLALTNAVQRVLFHVDNDALSINYDFTKFLKHDFISILNNDLNTLNHDLALACDCYRSYVMHVISPLLPNSIINNEMQIFLRWYIRLLAQILATQLLYLSREDTKHILTKTFPHNVGLKNEKVKYLISGYFDIYVAFTLLEGRLDGRLEPCEGILIVGENKL